MPYTTAIPVRPRHCDAQGMVHAARYYTFFEEAFLRWLDEVGPGYARLREDGMDLVIGRSSCRHQAPARLDDVLTIAVTATARTRSTITVEFAVTIEDGDVATGAVTYIAVRDGGACALPEAISALVR